MIPDQSLPQATVDRFHPVRAEAGACGSLSLGAVTTV